MSASSHTAKNAGKTKVSAGILVFRRTGGVLQVLLAHPGGPIWKNRENGAWTIPKGEPAAGESLEMAAKREFSEETGWVLPDRGLSPLTPVRQKAGKWIHAWSTEANRPVEDLHSNGFEMEWPPRSGRHQRFAEMDRFAWMDLKEAAVKINPAQVALLEELEKKLIVG